MKLLISTSALSDDPKYVKLKDAITAKKQKVKDAEAALKIAEKALVDYKKALEKAKPASTRKAKPATLPLVGKIYMLSRYQIAGTDNAPYRWQNVGRVKITNIDDQFVFFKNLDGYGKGKIGRALVSEIPKKAKFITERK